MIDSYLVQRAKFKKTEKAGIDGILKFDYMGSAEYEFGALPKSLRRIRANIEDYDLFLGYLGGKKVSVFCKKSMLPDVKNVIDSHARNEIITKEAVRFDRFCKGEKSEWTPDFWWDIENDFMWWARSKSNNNAFMDAITPK